MNRKIRLSLLIFISLILLVLCAHFRLEAQNMPGNTPACASPLSDPWKEEIFSGREFKNLVVSIQAEEEELYSAKTGLLTGTEIPQGREGEHPVRIFVYDENGTPLIAQNAGAASAERPPEAPSGSLFVSLRGKSTTKNFPALLTISGAGEKLWTEAGKRFRNTALLSCIPCVLPWTPPVFTIASVILWPKKQALSTPLLPRPPLSM